MLEAETNQKIRVNCKIVILKGEKVEMQKMLLL